MISEGGSVRDESACQSGDNSSGGGGQDLEFYIFGYNIAHSLSPALHNAGFQDIGLRGRYAVHESAAVDGAVEALLRRPAFGGASVTFPHKLQIGRLLDGVTPEAVAVGAVNTVVVRRPAGGGPATLIGDNTDWSGIRTCILGGGGGARDAADLARHPAVVWGAGGAARAACHALLTLGVRRVIVANRTASTAEAMAAQFPALTVRVVPTLHEAARVAREERWGDREEEEEERLPVRVVVTCVPADDVEESHVPEALFAAAPSGAGILVEMAYRPPVTATMRVAARHGWTVCNGMDVLKEQAFAQFELWTGRKAPKEVMKASMEREIERRRNEAAK